MSGSVKRHARLFGVLLAIGATLALVIGVFAGAGTAANAAAPPAYTSIPTIQGPADVPFVADTLQATTGTWSGHPTSFSYAWDRCNALGDRQGCAPISGATSASYTIQKADVGHTLDVNVTATNKAGSTTKNSKGTGIVSDKVAPKNYVRPSVSGNATIGSTLTASNGSWAGATSISFRWQQCDASGGSCADISGATSNSYDVRTGDVGTTLRVKVTATNKYGTTSETSSHTAVVSGRTTTTTTATTPAPPAGSSIPVDKVSLPNRLVVDKLSFSPNPTRSRGPIVARFHVSDTRGYSIQGALVYALGLPYSWLRNAAEVPTDASGWATITLQPTAAMPLQRGGSLVIFVRARKPGDNLLAGVSTRRLVQEGISR